MMRMPGVLTQQMAIHAAAMLGSLEIDFNVVRKPCVICMCQDHDHTHYDVLYTNKNSTNEYKQLLLCNVNINGT